MGVTVNMSLSCHRVGCLFFLGLTLVSGFDWTINHSGKKFVNIHLDSDHVSKPCLRAKSICVPITFSRLFCGLLQSADSDVEIKKILREQSCGFVFGEPMVCCPEGEVSEIAVCDINGDLKSKDISVKSTKEKIKQLLSGNGECGKRIEIQSDADRISDGEDAPPGDWPWMALFSYGHRGGRELFDCGGSLISLNTVVTSAHCLNKKTVLEVRLGETDLRTEYDCLDPESAPKCVCDPGCVARPTPNCNGGRECADMHIIRGVARQTLHPLYDLNTWEYDIGLVTLDRAVSISAFIRPVCLPLVPGDPNTGPDQLWFVTGWGITNPFRATNADTLQQVQVEIVNKQKCGEVWGITIHKSQVCAAGAGAGAVCVGDSGGPLVTKTGGVWELGAVV